MNRWRGAALIFAALLAAGPQAVAQDEEEKGRDVKWFGSLRVRPEYNDNLGDIASARDDKIGYASYRANFGTAIELDQDVSVLINVQALGFWGEEGTPQRGFQGFGSEDTNLIFHEAYVDAKKVFGTNLSIRGGRQPLVFGDEWLLGDSDFYGGTSWDGIRGTFENRFGEVNLFWSKVAETDLVEIFDPFGDQGGDFDLYGIWTDWKLDDVQSLDLAVLYTLDHREGGGVPWQDKRWTGHVRYAFGGEQGFFFNGNAAYQWGDTNEPGFEQKLSASAAELTGGFTWQRGGNPYQLFARLAQYSGDQASSVEDNETFVPIAQDNHARYGLLDLWTGQWGFVPYLGGPSGVQFIQVGFDATLPNTLRLRLQAQQVSRDEEAPGSDNKNLGKEFGLSSFYNYGKNLEVELGVGIFFPGASIALEPPFFGNSTARRIYINTVARF
jgi:hypothetical protein